VITTMSAIWVKATSVDPPVTGPTISPVTGDDRLQIDWLGHATALVELGGLRFLTDPALTTRLAHLRRHHAVDPTVLNDVDVVLISHVHMDHLHVPSLRLLGDVSLVVPEGAGRLLRRHGFADVAETRAGDRATFGSVTVETVPAVHPAGRGPHTRISAAAVGYVLSTPHRSVYFAGDTDLFDGMGGLQPVDVALLPIAGWGPTLGSGHLDPTRAARATHLIRPQLVVPIHWGTYSPITPRRRPPEWLDRPAEQFAAALANVGHADRLRLLDPGGRLVHGAVLPATTASDGSAT
jgi:L-ascorbate metabolism protein UlaG (beta-lactamase superfamily)